MSGERFRLLIGLGFLVIVFFSPDGVLGLWKRLKEWQQRDPFASDSSAADALGGQSLSKSIKGRDL